MVEVRDGSGHTVLQVDLAELCPTMVKAAVEWLEINHDEDTAQKDLVAVRPVYPEGRGGIAGVPVVMSPLPLAGHWRLALRGPVARSIVPLRAA